MKSLVAMIFFFSITSIRANCQAGSTGSRGNLTVVITGFKNNKGSASVALFDKADAFPKSPEKAVAIIYTKISDSKSVAVFEHLKAGEYAVSVYHDENDNKKLDANFFGIPKEGVGASNNARGHLGPPRYQDAKFIFKTNETISINIIYL